MQTFNSKSDLLESIKALPGYVPSDLSGKAISNFYDSGINYITERIIYTQTIDGSFRDRVCLCVHRNYIENDEEFNYWDLYHATTNETPEGLFKTVGTFSGPDLYYPWVESLYGGISRDGSDCIAVDVDLNPCDPSGAVYFNKSIYLYITETFGLQNTVACWSRCNEGDFVSINIDAPYDTGNGYAYAQVAKFGNKITIFGDNPMGTCYPPDSSPSMSWIPAGCRVRVEFYKMAINDPWYENEKGPFIDLDLIGQRIRQ